MREYELEILNQYDIEIISTRKVRGAFFCETNEGLMLLKEAGISDGRALLLYQLLRQLSGSGYENVDLPIFTKEQELISTSRDGTRYMLKHWFGGRECDVRREGDVLEAVRNLSLLHQKMRWEPDPEDDAADPATGEALCEDGTQAAESVKMPPAGRHLKEEFLCHTRELKKVRAFIRKRRNKGKFEALFLQHFEKMIRLATRAAEQLETSGYETLYEQSICGKRLVHGDYNYHNVLMPAGVHGTSDGWGCRERVATTGFEHFRMDVQVLDLYYFLRKVMEKHHWDVKFGDAMLEMYSRIRPLSQAEVVELKNGVEKKADKKMFPGYVLIHMVMNDDTWYVVRNTRGVTGFVGPGSKPVPLTEEEMASLGFHREEDVLVDFEVGDMVVVISGAWKDTVGAIKAINDSKKTITMHVEMFGRETPVELGFAEVKKM